MKKRLFQILDEMNVNDTEKNTQLVRVSGAFISGDKVKQGSKICMGADEQCLLDIMNEKSVPVLLVIDRVEYEKFRNQK